MSVAYLEEPRPTGHGRYQIFPDLTAEQLEELKADIAKNGPLTPVELDQDGNIIDGHQRMRAFLDLGIEDYPKVVREYASEAERWERVFALNMHRRHLSRAEKDRVVREMITRFPSWSSARIAKQAQVDTHTVIAKREALVSEGQDVPLDAGTEVADKKRSEILRLIGENPNASNREIGKLVVKAHGGTCSPQTVAKVREAMAAIDVADKAMQAAGEPNDLTPPEPEKGKKSASKAKEVVEKPAKVKAAKPSKTPKEVLTDRQFKALKNLYTRCTAEAQQMFREWL